MRRYREKSVEDEALYVVELFSLEVISVSMIEWLRLQSISPTFKRCQWLMCNFYWINCLFHTNLLEALSMTREKSLYLGMGKKT